MCPERSSRRTALLFSTLTAVIGGRSATRLVLLAIAIILAGILIALPPASSDAAHEVSHADSQPAPSRMVTD